MKDPAPSEMQEAGTENAHVPLLLASFQEIMQKHVGELREDHEYYMKVAYSTDIKLSLC